MNASDSPHRSRWLRFLLWCAAAFAASLLIVAIAVANMITLSRDAATLREAVVAAAPQHLHRQVQLSAGPATLAFARLVIGCIDDVPDEARTALRAVSSASVGVYQLEEPMAPGSAARMMQAADRRMNVRGWSRVVGVRNARDTVLVYMPADVSASGTQRFCLAVCNADHLVVVSAAADGAALASMADAHAGRISL